MPVSYLFYFDQHHLTMEGRVNAIENARLMVPQLVRDGNRAAVVSNAQSLDTVVEMTDDTDALIAGLDRLARDRSQWEIYAEQEEYRIRDVLELVEKHGQRMACSAARFYQLEESYRTDKALRTFSMVLGLLGGFDSPKAVVYFADTARAESGAYYFNYGRCRPDPVESRGPGNFGSQHALDRVIHEASADSIRLYTVQAQGLVLGDSNVIPGMSEATGARGSSGTPLTNTQRLRQAQNSLAGLALETGGRAFLNGVPAKKMVAAIESDMSCLHLISFPRGRSPARPAVARPVAHLAPQGQGQDAWITRRAESIRAEESRAYSPRSPRPARCRPTRTCTGSSCRPASRTDATRRSCNSSPRAPRPAPAEWDLGTSMISRGEFKDHASRRIRVDHGNVPVVFETEMTFRPGPFQLTLVAHDNVTDMLGTARVEGSWPDPRAGAGMGPIAVLQPAAGVFVRDGEVRRSGSLGQADQGLLRGDLETAMIGLVCRGPGVRELRIERFLVGDAATEFPPMEIAFGDERCTQVRDLIPAGTMTEGQFSYEIRVCRTIRKRSRKPAISS